MSLKQYEDNRDKVKRIIKKEGIKVKQERQRNI